ncbi:MAG: beta-galactosidase [Candidatus Ratteibacteria bacterium]
MKNLKSILGLCFFILVSSKISFTEISIPKFITEEIFILEDFKKDLKNWQHSLGISLSIDNLKGEKTLKVKYDFKETSSEEVNFDFKMPVVDIPYETVKFYLKGDSSGNKLQVWCSYKDKWILLSTISLDNDSWQHIQIPASEPFHFFYPEVKFLRFIISEKKKDSSGELLIKRIEMTKPQLIKNPIKTKKIPSPVFNTWGGVGNEKDILIRINSAINDIGINLHIYPIGFPKENKDEYNNMLEKVANFINLVKDTGIMIGISFYNTPPEEFIKKYPDLFPKNELGQIYNKEACFLSPWHPESYRIWRNHIVYSLNYLKNKNLLKYIKVIFLCPGEESEISYEWSHIWAFDDYAIKAYRQYLMNFYKKDIKLLNTDWCTNYASFEDINPPKSFNYNRERWVFLNFYRWSMFKWCVQLAEAVKIVYEPEYWLWLAHSVPTYPQRFYSARYPIFYIENLKKLGLIDYTHLPALDWQSTEDIELIKKLGVKIIGEVDVAPSPEKMKWTFEQSKKFGFDGVYIGIMENLFTDENKLSPAGEQCKKLISNWK